MQSKGSLGTSGGIGKPSKKSGQPPGIGTPQRKNGVEKSKCYPDEDPRKPDVKYPTENPKTVNITLTPSISQKMTWKNGDTRLDVEDAD